LTISSRPTSSPSFHRRCFYVIDFVQNSKALEDRTLEKGRELDVVIRRAKVEETQAGVRLLVWRWLNDAGVLKIQIVILYGEEKSSTDGL